MDQLNLDGFSLSELQALDTELASALTARLTTTNGSGAAGVDAYKIKGREITFTALKDLLELRANVKNAIAKKAAEPDGLGIAIVELNDPDSPRSGGDYRWPFLS